MARRPNILAVPFPAQGHVLPLMELSQHLIKNGFKITFVNTEFNHRRVLNAAVIGKDNFGDHISLVSVPDGLEPQDDRTDVVKLTQSVISMVPAKLEELIHKINEEEDDKITCMIADLNCGWAVQVAHKLNIRCAAFWPASAAVLSQIYSVHKLIQDGIIDKNGTPLENKKIQLAPEMPAMSTSNFIWSCFSDDEITGKIVFGMVETNLAATKLADWMVCNSAYDVEPAAFTLHSNIQPIGPLLASTRQGNPAGCFWKEDTNCLQWLDKQPPKSVIYVAFGSHTVLDKNQLEELVLGLELTGKPFLWVRRPGITEETNCCPKGFEERVGDRGKIVEWAPQQKVLSHSAVGCFLSHCGWNSTMEGVANGVPFLCWPYFADQFINETYICDVWKVGLSFDRDESGIIDREEIKSKVQWVLSDREIMGRVKGLKELAIRSVGESGNSTKVFNSFIEWLRM